MSSLLQFRGKSDRRGVGLEVYLHRKETVLGLGFEHHKMVSCDQVTCNRCGRPHDQLYRFYRKPKGMFGPWVVFRYNGEDHVPDLSCPMGLEKLPRDAVKLTPDENAEAWHAI